MASSAYMTGRKKYSRPQAMLWSENAGTLDNGLYVPTGLEVGSQTDGIQETNQFIVLSDDNRAEISFAPTRIERRERMINGRMRSYHIADKLTISTSWTMLPSRSFSTLPDFNATTGATLASGGASSQFTTDGGAGGAELLDWYENHSGSFWVFLSYDDYKAFGNDAAAYNNLAKYSQIVEVFFADFQYSVVKRGGSNHDFWNISVTLEEV